MVEAPARNVWHQNVYCLDGIQEDSYIYHVRDGYYYHFSWRRGNALYLKCIHCRTHACNGRAMVDVRYGFRHTKHHRNHQPDELFQQEKLLRRRILDRCRALDRTLFKDIVRQERAGFDREVQLRVPYLKLRSSMGRIRRANYPPPPQNLQELADILMNPQNEVITQTTDGEDNIFGGAVQTRDGHFHILFASHRLLQLLRHCRYVFSDGTFKVVPAIQSLRNRAAQVFVIVTSWRGHTLPIAWAVMENHTQESYEAILGLINQNLGGVVNIHTLITDDEPGQYNAWRAVFPNIRSIQDCLFHMARCYIRKINNLGIAHHFHNPDLPQFLVIVRMSCSLPLLPVNLLIMGWVCVRRETTRIGGQLLRNILNPFFAYLWDEHVGNLNKRERMSVYGSAHRTNNCCESTNRSLIDKFGAHPGSYDFINGLLDFEDQAYSDYLLLCRGLPASRGRRTSVLNNDRALQRLAADLENPPFGQAQAVLTYLQAAAHRIEGLVNDVAELH